MTRTELTQCPWCDSTSKAVRNIRFGTVKCNHDWHDMKQTLPTRTELIAELREASEDSMVDYCFDGRPMRDLILKSADMLEADDKPLFYGHNAEHWHKLAVLRFQESQELEEAARLALSALAQITYNVYDEDCLTHKVAAPAIAALKEALK